MMARCQWCDGDTDYRSVCPWSLECPHCCAEPGHRCERPSGHVAARMHAARYELAERLDREAGIDYDRPLEGPPT